MKRRPERRGEDVRGVFRKSWNNIFLSDRRPGNEDPWVQVAHEQIAWTDDGLGTPYTDDIMMLFMQDYTEDGPSSQVTDVLNFCRGASLQDLSDDVSPRRGAWLDDTVAPTSHHFEEPQKTPRRKRRQKNQKHMGLAPQINKSDVPRARAKDTYRLYEGPLSASALRNYLKEKRFSHPTLPSADRRLIYISDPDPYYMLVLAESAPRHQVFALREGIWKYISRQTWIKVAESVKGYVVFQLELHIPFFALRTNKQNSSVTSPKPVKPHRRWTDLSFVATDEPTKLARSTAGIYEAQISLVICGFDDKCWVAYCFVDTDFDEDAELGEDNFSHDGMMEDPIAADGDYDANMPIFDAREYFIMVFLFRISQVLGEWRNLVRNVEDDIETFVKAHPPFAILVGQGKINNEFLDNSQWAIKTLHLLGKLLGSLSNLISVWSRFSASNGDIQYFTDLRTASDETKGHIRRSLIRIEEKFADLEALEQKLEMLVEQCQTYRKDAENAHIVLMFRTYQLMVETNHTAHRSGTVADITILVLPFALVSAFFSIPGDDMSFKRTPRSFVIAVVGSTIGMQLVFWFLRNYTIPLQIWERMKGAGEKTETHPPGPNTMTSGYWDNVSFRRKARDADTIGMV